MFAVKPLSDRGTVVSDGVSRFILCKGRWLISDDIDLANFLGMKVNRYRKWKLAKCEPPITPNYLSLPLYETESGDDSEWILYDVDFSDCCTIGKKIRHTELCEFQMRDNYSCDSAYTYCVAIHPSNGVISCLVLQDWQHINPNSNGCNPYYNEWRKQLGRKHSVIDSDRLSAVA